MSILVPFAQQICPDAKYVLAQILAVFVQEGTILLGHQGLMHVNCAQMVVLLALILLIVLNVS